MYILIIEISIVNITAKLIGITLHDEFVRKLTGHIGLITT